MACNCPEIFRLIKCAHEHIVCQIRWTRDMKAYDCSEVVNLITCAHERIDCEIW